MSRYSFTGWTTCSALPEVLAVYEGGNGNNLYDTAHNSATHLEIGDGEIRYFNFPGK